jgi:hypothetical protein
MRYEKPLQTWFQHISEWRRKKNSNQWTGFADMETNQWLLFEKRLNIDLKLQLRSERAANDIRNGKIKVFGAIAYKTFNKRARIRIKNERSG